MSSSIKIILTFLISLSALTANAEINATTINADFNSLMTLIKSSANLSEKIRGIRTAESKLGQDIKDYAIAANGDEKVLNEGRYNLAWTVYLQLTILNILQEKNGVIDVGSCRNARAQAVGSYAENAEKNLSAPFEVNRTLNIINYLCPKGY